MDIDPDQSLLYKKGDTFCSQAYVNLNRNGVDSSNATGTISGGKCHQPQLQGMGTVKFLHMGATYVGMFVNGTMEGQGCMTFLDGSEYKGMFHGMDAASSEMPSILPSIQVNSWMGRSAGREKKNFKVACFMKAILR